MGLYQAYIGVFAVTFSVVLMLKLQDETDGKKVLRYGVQGIAGAIVGGILYIILTKLLLLRAGVDMATYRGAANVSPIWILQNLPSSVVKCYQEFNNFFFDAHMYHTTSTSGAIIILLGLMFCIFCLFQFICLWKKSKWRAFLFAVCLLTLPIASNCCLIIAVGNGTSMLMAMGMAVASCLIIVFMPQQMQINFWARSLCYLVMIIFLWNNVLTVVNDQVALKEGKTATVALTNQVLNALSDEGHLTDGSVIAMVGRPSENACFAKNTAFQTANAYARFGGSWSVSAGNNRRSWFGVLSEYCGTSLNLAMEDQYNNVIQSDEITGMPDFPADGSIQEIDGIITVKVSQLY